jgi:hypothetical protein
MQLDVVIPCHPKDREILSACIQGVLNHVWDQGQIYVVSKEHLTDDALWIPESLYPFTLADIEAYPAVEDRGRWYYQQLLKLYAHQVGFNLSPRFLLLDADTVFLRPVRFTDTEGRALFATTENPIHRPYLRHIERLVPGLGASDPSAIAHHMVVDQVLMTSLFGETARRNHGCFWRSFMGAVENEHPQAASEYELLYHYRRARLPDSMALRPLRWEDVPNLKYRPDLDFISCHSHSRDLTP